MNEKVTKLIELCVIKDGAWCKLEELLIKEGMCVEDAEFFCELLASSKSPERKNTVIEEYKEWEKQEKPSNYFQMLKLLD
ncbi:hypothetical protein [Vibrio pelagius]|uniref:hypothetical protein n=1 Tax=Vibrio pelagius TaxID=28169 RepID=UPI0021C4C7A9|nr:hypothetical protein [Vibrio pelagius]